MERILTRLDQLADEIASMRTEVSEHIAREDATLTDIAAVQQSAAADWREHMRRTALNEERLDVLERAVTGRAAAWGVLGKVLGALIGSGGLLHIVGKLTRLW